MRIDIWNGRGGLSEAEIAMATPDATEAKDLVVHVERCAKRFRLLTEGQNNLHSDVSQTKTLLIIIGGYLVLVSEPAKNVIGTLLKMFSGG